MPQGQKNGQCQPLHPVHELLPLLPRLPALHQKTFHVPLLCATPYSCGPSLPGPHLPQGRRLQAHVKLVSTSLPHSPNCGDDYDAVSPECRARPVPPPQPEAPLSPASDPSSSSCDSWEDLEMEDDGCPALATPQAIATSAVYLSTPKPSCRRSVAPTGAAQPVPTGQAAPPVMPSDPRIHPGNE